MDLVVKSSMSRMLQSMYSLSELLSTFREREKTHARNPSSSQKPPKKGKALDKEKQKHTISLTLSSLSFSLSLSLTHTTHTHIILALQINEHVTFYSIKGYEAIIISLRNSDFKKCILKELFNGKLFSNKKKSGTRKNKLTDMQYS